MEQPGPVEAVPPRLGENLEGTSSGPSNSIAETLSTCGQVPNAQGSPLKPARTFHSKLLRVVNSGQLSKGRKWPKPLRKAALFLSASFAQVFSPRPDCKVTVILLSSSKRCGHSVDGRNPFLTTSKAWETIVCWHLQGDHSCRVSLVAQDFVPPYQRAKVPAGKGHLIHSGSEKGHGVL